MKIKTQLCCFLTIAFAIPHIAVAQNFEKIQFDQKDTVGGYYLAIRPLSNQVKGTLVFFTSFATPESLLPETRLHNVASANDLLTIIAFTPGKLYADPAAVDRVNKVLKDVATRFSADTSHFALGGFGEAGSIALRYTEMTYEHPAQFPLQPKAVFGIDCPVDLFDQWHWSEKQIKKNYWPGAVGDARYYLDAMTKENGSIYDHPETYRKLSPFYTESDTIGNEQFLKNVAVRLYYDTDIQWHLKNRRNSFFDTNMAGGSEMIKRLLLEGNDKAEFISSRPGWRSNGTRTPSSISIVEEVDCIKWLRSSLDIFDANTWTPPYDLPFPPKWGVERFSLPPDFAPGFTYKGVEDLRFTPGWGDSTSTDYWSYTYVWLLNGQARTDATTLEANLRAYYTGLVGRNIPRRNIPESKLVPVTVTLKKAKSLPGDSITYSGQIRMLDYMAQRPMALNALIHIKDDPGGQYAIVFVEVSPKPLSHPVWEQMNNLEKAFRLRK